MKKELEINFGNIWKNIRFVLNPLGKNRNTQNLDDIDLAGPLLICLLLGFVLLLQAKVHFGYIYGVGTLGCVGIYLLLNLMTEKGVDLYKTVCILGYCLLPMVLLAVISTIVPFFVHAKRYNHSMDLISYSWPVIGLVASWIVIAWCTWSAAGMFVTSLNIHRQKWLVAYPVFLMYVAFAMITVL
jgi:hypothetical protein